MNILKVVNISCDPTTPQSSIFNADFDFSVIRVLKIMIRMCVRAYAQLRSCRYFILLPHCWWISAERRNGNL